MLILRSLSAYFARSEASSDFELSPPDFPQFVPYSIKRVSFSLQLVQYIRDAIDRKQENMRRRRRRDALRLQLVRVFDIIAKQVIFLPKKIQFVLAHVLTRIHATRSPGVIFYRSV